MNQRQQARREKFQDAFAKMPMGETWTVERNKLGDAEYFNACRDTGGVVLERETRTVSHVKAIPRRVRRSMARDLAKRT